MVKTRTKPGPTPKPRVTKTVVAPVTVRPAPAKKSAKTKRGYPRLPPRGERTEKEARVGRGRQARKSGHGFERTAAEKFREYFATWRWAKLVRRSDQAHGPHQGDLTGLPGLWTECQKAAHLDPARKYAQALRDLDKAKAKGACPKTDIPIVVMCAKGTAKILVVLELVHFYQMVSGAPSLGPVGWTVTVTLEQFFAAYKLHLTRADEALL